MVDIYLRDASQTIVLSSLLQVAQSHALEPLAHQLTALRHLMAEDLSVLEHALQQIMQSSQQHLPHDTAVLSSVQHLLHLKGKRIRPLCVLLAARLGPYAEQHQQHIHDLAVACELVHAATLLHDDVIDESAERRGSATARMLFGNAASILAGDHLLLRALRLVLDVNQLPLLQRLLTVIDCMVSAEALQLERRGRFDPNQEMYWHIVRGKTAALFGWGLYAGGYMVGLHDGMLHALEKIGEHVGMAFQLMDDILDLEGDPHVTGKDTLADIREGKLTLPIILAAERNTALCETFSNIACNQDEHLSDNVVAQLVYLVKQTDALAEAKLYARKEVNHAYLYLQELPAGVSRSALQMLVESAVNRIA